MDQIEELKKALENLGVHTTSNDPAVLAAAAAASLQAQNNTAPKSLDEAAVKKYQFWETQPVPRLNEDPDQNCCIEPNKPPEEIRQNPYRLPEGFIWETLDIDDHNKLTELYTLLNENYVEDDDNMFRFDYSPLFLQWALKPPEWRGDWHVGVRVQKTNKLVGFISAIPANIHVHTKPIKVVEINFLCVHKKLRSKRMAPVLIQEITRRVNLVGIFQAVYTAGVILPKPVGTCRYWHRSLNPKKLIDVKFSHIGKNMTLPRTLKLYKLPDSPTLEGIRPIEKRDLKKVKTMLNEYLRKFDLSPTFNDQEVAHWFLPREGIIESFVVERKDAKGATKLAAFASFYALPSTVMHHPTHKSLNAAYSYYNVVNEELGVNLQDLMHNTLIIAKSKGYDVFNALDLMDNKEFLEKEKFGVGDGNLQYYLFNWRCPALTPERIGLVLQ